VEPTGAALPAVDDDLALQIRHQIAFGSDRRPMGRQQRTSRPAQHFTTRDHHVNFSWEFEIRAPGKL
jgi:hypothetical protein